MRAFRWLVLSLALGLVVTDWQAGAQAPTSVITGTDGVVLYGIGDLPGTGGIGSSVRDAMKAGATIYAVGASTVHATATAPNRPQLDTPVLWTWNGTSGTLEPLPTVPNTHTTAVTAYAISEGPLLTPAQFLASQARVSDTISGTNWVRVDRTLLPDLTANLNLSNAPGTPAFAALAMSSDGGVIYGQRQNGTGGFPTETRVPVRHAPDLGFNFPSLIPTGKAWGFPIPRGTSADGMVMVGAASDGAVQLLLNPNGTFGTNAVAFRYEHDTTPNALTGVTTAIPTLTTPGWNMPVALSSDGERTLVIGNSDEYPNGEVYFTNSDGLVTERLGSPNTAWLPRALGGMTADGAVVAVTFSGNTSFGPGQIAGLQIPVANKYAYIHNMYGWVHFSSILAAHGVDLGANGWDPANFAITGIRTVGGVDLVFGEGRRRAVGTVGTPPNTFLGFVAGAVEGFVVELPAGVLADFNPLPTSPSDKALVGGWTTGDLATTTVAFAHMADGTLYRIQPPTPINPTGATGFERGLYTWAGNAAGGAYTITTLQDTNGAGGSNRNGELGFSLTVAGDEATIVDENCVGCPPFIPLNRAAVSPGSIVGGWLYGNAAQPDNSAVLILLNNGRYFYAQDQPDDDGAEMGTYTWNPETGAFAVTEAAGGTEQLVATLSRDSLSFNVTEQGGEPVFTGTRIVDSATVVPVITSALIVEAAVNQPFVYLFTANYGLTFTATGLPPGLAFDPASGLISGMPTMLGDSSIALSVSNSFGSTTNATLMLSVKQAQAALSIVGAPPSAAPGTSFTVGTTGGSSSGAVTFTTSGGACSNSGALVTMTSGAGLCRISAIKDGDSIYGPATATATVTASPSSTLAITSGSDFGTWSIGLVNGQGLSASGGTAPYSWTIVSGALPPGVSIRTDLPSHLQGGPSSAALVGVATTAGLYSFRLRVQDSVGVVAEQDVTMRISSLTIKDFWTLADAFVGVQYSFTLTAMRNGAAVAATWNAVAGLPPGVTLDAATGALSGTPTQSGTYSILLSATEGGETVFRTETLTVYAVGIDGAGVLPNATQGVAYLTTLTASGGTPPYSFSGSGLPAGLTLQNDGTLSGVVTRPDVYRFTVTATDSTGQFYNRPMALAVTGVPPVLPSVLPGGLAFADCSFGTPCSVEVNVINGGSAPFTWSATGLPPGMSIRPGAEGPPFRNPSAGDIYGVPTQLGTYQVAVIVTDGSGASATNTFPLRVSELTLANSTTATWTRDAASTQEFRVLGGPSLPAPFAPAPSGSGPGSTLYTANIVEGSQPAPAGVSLIASPPAYSGTPIENIFTVPRLRFTSVSGGQQLDAFYVFSVAGGGSTISISSNGDLGTLSTGLSYSNQLSACCAPSLTWVVVSGNPPANVMLSTSGLLSGTPQASAIGTHTFVVEARDSGNPANFGRRQFTVSVVPASFTSSFTLPAGNVGTFYQTTLAASTTATWSLNPLNHLPPGLSLTPGGSLTGTPTASGQYRFGVTATTSGGALVGTHTVSIYPAGVNPPVNFSMGNQGPFAMTPLTFQLTGATGGTGTGYQYSYTPGAPTLPGFRVQNGAPLPTSFPGSTTAGLLGVPTAPGVYPTSIRVTDSAGGFIDRAFTVTISPLHIMSQGTLPKATVGVPYSFTVVPTGGSQYSWSATGLPAGLSIDTGSGVISGTPSAAGATSPQIRLTDQALGHTISLNHSLTVDPFAITTGGVLPSGTVGVAYSPVTFAATGCGACTWSLSGSLPNGLAFNASTATLGGTPTGTFNGTFTVAATSGGTTVSKIFALQVVASAPQLVQFASPGTMQYSTVGSIVSQQLVASGGLPPYTFSLDAGTLPPGLSLQGPGDTISANLAPGFTYLAGRGLQVGSYTFTLRATDSLGGFATRTISWTVSPLSQQYTSLPANGGQIVNGQPFSGQLLVIGGSATDGIGNYTWTNTSALPYNLALSGTDGVVSGTPIEQGNFSAPIQVVDNGNDAKHAFNVSLNIGGATTVSFGLGSTLSFQQGFSFSSNLSLTGGTPPYNVTAETPLPPGFELLSGAELFQGAPANSVFLAGTPLASGVFTFTLRAEDSATTPNTRLRTYTATVTPFTLIINTTLPDGAVGQPYSESLMTAGSGSVVWSVAPGNALPPGLTLSNGVLSGIPSVANANYSFALEATDASGIVRSTTFNLRISAVAQTSPQVIPVIAVVGEPYYYQLVATGGPVTWAVTGGTLPSGVTLTAAGELTATSVGQAGTFSFFATATPQGGGITHTRRFTLFSRLANPTMLDFAYANTALADITAGQAATIQLAPNGGRAPYSWNVAPGSTLPPGLQLIAPGAQGSPLSQTFTPGQAAIAGVATTAGTYSFDLIVTDALGVQARRTFTLNVTPIGIIPGTVRNPTAGASYAHQFVGVGGTAPYTFSMTRVSALQDMLPPGLSLSPSGLISGTPTSTGNYAFLVRMQDAAGNTLTRRINNFIVANSAGAFVSNNNPQDTQIGVGRRPVLTLAVQGGPAGATYSWSVAPGSSLPPGMSLFTAPPLVTTPNTTMLAGQPTAVGTFTFTLRATQDGNPANTADHTFTLRVAPMQLIAPPIEGALGATLPPGVVGVPYSTTVRAAGGRPPYRFEVSPFTPLPTGLSLHSTTGVLSGTPQYVGNTLVAFVITDDDGFVLNSLSSVLTVTPPGTPVPLQFLAGIQIDASVGVPFNFNLDVQLLRGGTPPFTWVVSEGTLPEGLSILPGSNGVSSYVAGIPTTASPPDDGFPFSLTVTDATGQRLTTETGLKVSPLALTPDTLAPGKVGVPYSATLTPAGGTGPYSIYVMPNWNMPPGLTLNPSGLLQGTPTHAGSFPIYLMLSDSAGEFVQRLYRITIDNATGEAPAVNLTPTPIQIFHVADSSNPVPTQVSVNATNGPLPYALSLAGINGASLSQDTGTAPGTSNINWNLTNVGPGTYFGLLGVRSANAANLIDQVPITLTVAAAPPCTYSLTPVSGSVSAAGGSGSFNVTTAANCSWSAAVAPSDTWLTLTNASSGTGPATIAFSAAPNGGVSSRTGTIDVQGQTYTVTQFGSSCAFAISPMMLSAPAAGGSAVVNVAASNVACTWNASDLGVMPSSGVGNGSVMVTIPANTAATSRMLTATVAGQTFTVNQAGIGCGVTLSPYEASSPAAGGSGSVLVTPTPGCSYDTVLGPSWISVTSGGSGSLPTTLVYSVQANSTTVQRSGTLVIGGTPFVITQEGVPCSVTLDTANLGSPWGTSQGVVGTIGVQANGPNCSWVAGSSAPWASVSPTSGSGNATLQVSVDTNDLTVARSAELTVAGQVVPVTQTGTVCSFALQSDKASMPAGGGQGSVGVIAASACTWSAATNTPAWLTILSSGSAGSASVQFSALPNPDGIPRVGTLTIAGKTFTVTQAPAACSFTLDTPGAASDSSGGSGSFGFSTATTGCSAPSAISFANWVTVTEITFVGTAGTVSYTSQPNPTAFQRQASIQLGDKAFTITQSGGTCGFSLGAYNSLFGQAGGPGGVFATATATGCTPLFGTNDPFVTLGTLQQVGSSFTLPFTVAPYSSVNPSVRYGRITFGGQIHTVKQTSW